MCGTENALRKRSADVGSKVSPLVKQAAPNTDVRVISSAELALHNKPGDAWVAIRKKVYDVSKFAAVHPGGPVIFTYAGKDATDVFGAFHAAETWNKLPGLCIGQFQPAGPTPQLVEDFRAVKAEMVRRGLYKSSPLFYVYKTVTTLMLLAAGLATAYYGQHSALWVVLGATLTGLFWQQTGWLAHDFCHNQVFKARWLNHAIGGYFLGDVAMGFSAYWWKFKHNKHHAAPNECDEVYNAVDPDIDTLPFLAWSEEILGTVESKWMRRLLSYQRELFFPLLMFARMAWCHSSLQFVFSDEMPKNSARPIERVLILAHHLWVLSFAFGALPLPMGLLWLLVSEVVGGLLLGFVFVQSHNGMEVYNEEKDFYTAQIISTRDVKESLFNDWLSGGLNRQIEHHLFPTLPRHSLKECTKLVSALCAKHGLVYEDVDWKTGTGLVLRHLAKVAATA